MIQLVAFPFDFDISVIYLPQINGLFVFPNLIKQFSVFLNLAINRRLADHNTTLIEDFLNFTIAKIVSKIIANSHNNHVCLELRAFKKENN